MGHYFLDTQYNVSVDDSSYILASLKLVDNGDTIIYWTWWMLHNLGFKNYIYS